MGVSRTVAGGPFGRLGAAWCARCSGDVWDRQLKNGSSTTWAQLADESFAAGRVVESYAYARTGYHRGLDQLRRNGWKGHGPVPWEHEPNRGFLRSLHALGRAAGAIGETVEAERCATFLRDSSPAAADALGSP